jgi:hypothetical protein
MNSYGRRIAGCVVALLFVLGGLAIIIGNTHSDAELQRQGEANIADFTPKCDGKTMSPGDSCWRIGGSEPSRTYQEEIDHNRDINSVASLGRTDRNWRIFGFVVLGFGAFLLYCFVLGVLAVRRARVGRARLAQARGWTYQRTDPALNGRLQLPTHEDTKPEAADIISGTYLGQPFVVFDYLKSNGNKETAFALTLPAPVPRMVLSGSLTTNRVDARTAPEGRNVLNPELLKYLNEHHSYAFAADGTAIVRGSDTVRSPKPEVIEKHLEALAKAGSTLVAAAQQAYPRTDQH